VVQQEDSAGVDELASAGGLQEVRMVGRLELLEPLSVVQAAIDLSGCILLWMS
jgi:hypothetical protein